MISRRKVIGVSGGVLLGSALAGCLSETVSIDLLQIKAITVEWRHENRSYSSQILKLHSDGESGITGQVATEYDHIISSPAEITVSEETQETLESEFEEVHYVIGVCGNELNPDHDHDCRNASTPREDFNSIQFGDRADVKIDHDLIDIQNVESGDVEDWNTDISRFKWSERHAGHGQ